jgi:GNAT superfamily N-acetyltransferase/uncharacterized glyoxalase superfamily protein PhnB
MLEITYDQKPSLLHVEPVLAVKDVVEAITYWHEVLGFPSKWMWGDPPNHGGVSWNGAAFIQFSLDPQQAQRAEGHSIWIRVRNLEALYRQHQEKAKIVAPLVNRPWGMADYTIQDLNGYYVTFSEPASERGASSQGIPPGVRVVKRQLAPAEFKKLLLSVGWSDSYTESQLTTAVLTVVAEDTETKEAIGCAFLVGDNQAFYYVRDVIVRRDWQRKRIGTAMMQSIMDWLKQHAPEGATVGLFTGDGLASFYRSFGFMQACGMYQTITRKK